MSELTRRAFVTKSAGTAVGMTAVGVLATGEAQARESEDHGPVSSDQVVAYVRDPRTGEVSVMAGAREVTIKDRKLAARLSRAATR
jgi:hypothetical protein